MKTPIETKANSLKQYVKLVMTMLGNKSAQIMAPGRGSHIFFHFPFSLSREGELRPFAALKAPHFLIDGNKSFMLAPLSHSVQVLDVASLPQPTVVDATAPFPFLGTQVNIATPFVPPSVVHYASTSWRSGHAVADLCRTHEGRWRQRWGLGERRT